MANGVAESDPKKLSSQRRELLELLLREKQQKRRDAPGYPREIGRRPDGEPAVLSFGQRRLWFIEQLQPGSAAYHVPGAVRMAGELDREVLAQALDVVGRRHEVLRTGFPLVKGEPTPRIDDEPSLELRVEDLRDVPEGDREAELARRVDAAVLTPFDLARPPLARTHLFRLRDDEHVFLLILHHIISDIWSVGVFFRNVTATYDDLLDDGGSPLPPLPIQYGDYALWQRELLSGDSLERLLDFWREHLKDAPRVIDLPTDHPRPPEQSFEGGRRYMQLTPALTDALKEVAGRDEASLYMLLAAALNTLLFRYTGQSSILVGVPISNRNRLELEQLVGLLFNQVVLRSDLAAGLLFRDLLKTTRESLLQVIAHQDLPFERLVQEAGVERDMSRNPLFQVLFAYQNVPPSRMAARGLTLSRYEVSETTSREDLELDMRETPEGLAGWFGYDAALFDATTVERMARQFQNLLAAVAEAPETPLGELPLASAAERQQLLLEWSGPGAPEDPDEATFPEVFAGRVAAAGDAPASRFEGRSRSYRELDRLASRVALGLRRRGVGAGDLVALLAPRSDDFLAVILGVWKAGAAYLPLDPGHPPHRHRQVLTRARAALVLADAGRVEAAREGLPETAAPEVVDWTPWLDGAEAPSGAWPAPDPDSLAYVIFTSGSTGQPKGAMVHHRGMVNHLWAKVEDLGLTAADTVVQNASQCFDISVWQWMSALLVGGRVVTYGDEIAHDPLRLLETAEADRVTVLETVPSLLRVALTEALRLPPERRPGFEALRWMISTGEALPPELARDWAAAYPAVPLFNAYGPTECSDDVTHHVVRPAGNETPREPIGRPVRRTRLYVVDGGFRPTLPGVPGELVVTGVGVGRGYLNDPGRTAEVFCPDPFAGETGEAGARLYRTGDRTRWRRTGTLDFLGRLDFQVKVRGFRIELEEIEAALTTAPGVEQAAVLVAQPEGAPAALVAYVTRSDEMAGGTGEPDETAVRHHLGRRLPEYMVPDAFVVLDALPLNPSGKVDRKALAELAVGATARETEYVEPRTPVEARLAEVWRELLGAERVGAADHFFDVGGQSLIAAQLISRIRESFGVELSVRAVFQAPVLEELARVVEDAMMHGGAGAELPLEPRPEDAEAVASFGQERFWFIDRWRPNLTAYNIFGAVRMRGSLDVDVLRESFEELLRRHEVLRTVFREEEGRPLPVVLPAGPSMDLPRVDLRSMEPSARHPRAVELGNDFAQAPFDLENGPLIRALLIRLADDDHVLAVTAHHIVYDVWSREILVRELGRLYEAFWHRRPSPLTELPIQYGDFAHWQRQWLSGEALDEQMGYWRERLEGAGSGIEVPGDRPRPPVQTFRGARTELELPAAVTDGLKALARRVGGTPFMALMAGFATFLHRYTGEEDLVLGSPIANRNRKETESLIGFLVNTLVLRLDVSGGPTFLDLMERARQVALGAYSHQDLPFELLVNELRPARDASRQPFFQILFNYMTNYQPIAMELPELSLTPEANHSGAAQFDWILSMYEVDGRLHLTSDYSTDLYDRTTLERFLRHFGRILEDAVGDPERPFHELSPFSAAELHQVRHEWNDTARALPEARGAHQVFEDQVRRTPDAPAVDFGDTRWTYGELDRRANDLAHELVAVGVRAEDVVAVVMERGADYLVALLGILKAGAVYLPLLGRHPVERMRKLLEQSATRLVLLGDEFAERLEARLADLEAEGAVDGLAVRRWSSLGIDPERPRAAAPPPFPDTPDPLAYVVYTSGSTGLPKGAMVHHRGLLNHLMLKAGDLAMGPGDAVAQTATQTFDIHVWQFLTPLLVGARVVVLPDEVTHDPEKLLAETAAAGVTVLETVPSLLKLLVDPQLDRPELPELRWLMATGEALPPGLVRRWLEIYPHAPVVNAYGPTECSDDVTHHFLSEPPEDDRRQVPIGRALDNLHLMVLGADLRPTPMGAVGELHAGGVGVGRGYLRDPRRTAEAFLPDPFAAEPGRRMYRTGDLVRQDRTGEITFLGRRDHQVKIRGSRVELGEIESVLTGHDDVEQAVVLVRESPTGEPRLVAFLAAAPALAREPARLRAFLEDALPDFMIPASFAFTDALPVNSSGKVDRRALEALEVEEISLQAPYVAPRNETEETLAAIWSDLLGVERVGAFDNFFDLGGHSLLTTQLVSRLRGAFQTDVPLPTFFEDPTVAGLAEALEVARWAGMVAEENAESTDEELEEEELEMEFGEV
jgi:amino acid adenylation domain-containing protein